MNYAVVSDIDRVQIKAQKWLLETFHAPVAFSRPEPSVPSAAQDRKFWEFSIGKTEKTAGWENLACVDPHTFLLLDPSVQ